MMQAGQRRLLYELHHLSSTNAANAQIRGDFGSAAAHAGRLKAKETAF